MKLRAIVLLGAVAAACLLLLTLQMRDSAGRASDLLAVVTTPVQSALARVNRLAVGAWSTYRDWKNVRAENRRLRDEAQQLRVEALRVAGENTAADGLEAFAEIRGARPAESLAQRRDRLGHAVEARGPR